jgi:8-oxo-dGTP pyrophosphatase MutT (NUDIX family)
MRALVEPRPAATIILCRPRPLEKGADKGSSERSGFEVLLVKRHGKSGFMAGAHVFPGGRVDDADYEADDAVGSDDRARALLDGMDARTARGFVNAALRETMEEAGIKVRARDLKPWSWWITPAEEPKRFDTRFFICEVSSNAEAKIDDHEAVAFAWFTPKEALAAYERGEIVLAPPTLCTLEDLAPFSSVEDAVMSVRRPLRPVCPRMVTPEGVAGLVLALPGDPLHDVRERAFEVRTRVVMADSGRFTSAFAPRT